MNLYLIKRTDEVDYDEYDAAVMRAPNPERAKEISPVSIYPTEMELLAENVTGDEGIVLGSFNAG